MSMLTEGFIVEVDCRIDGVVLLEVNGEKYKLLVKEMLKSSQIIDLFDESYDLLKTRYGFTEYYRNDSWWHNSYKIKIGQACRSDEYIMNIKKTIDTRKIMNLRCRVWETNGSVAWSSPIFMRGE